MIGLRGKMNLVQAQQNSGAFCFFAQLRLVSTNRILVAKRPSCVCYADRESVPVCVPGQPQKAAREGCFVMSTSRLQNSVAELLKFYLPKVEVKENHRPDWLITPGGNRLELDFFIDSLGIAIEVQGEQHYRYVEFFHGNYEGFQKRLEFDDFKRETCRRAGISLIEISEADELREILDMLRQIFLQGESDLFHLKKRQAEALVTAWFELKKSNLYEKVRKARDTRKWARYLLNKALAAGKRSDIKSTTKFYKKKLHRFHSLNNNLYQALVDRYIELMNDNRG